MTEEQKSRLQAVAEAVENVMLADAAARFEGVRNPEMLEVLSDMEWELEASIKSIMPILADATESFECVSRSDELDRMVDQMEEAEARSKAESLHHESMCLSWGGPS